MATFQTPSAERTRGNTPTPPLAEVSDEVEVTDGRSSPPTACAICLGHFKNKSFAENCLHQFCFECLLTWSKIKAECPLCKQPFKHIMHNVRSNNSYDKYTVEQPETLEAEIEPYYSPRFRYRTTLTVHPRENGAIQRLLLGFQLPEAIEERPFRRSYCSFRRNVYRRNLWVLPLPDVTGRLRDCSPEFYRTNPAQVNRLVAWLSRELRALDSNTVSNVLALQRITSSLNVYPINSRNFRDQIADLIPLHTDHFIHELFMFARSPYDIYGYDRSASYHQGGPLVSHNYVNEISSSEDDSTDSDIMMLSPPPPAVSAQRNFGHLSSPVVIESILQSETEDSSDEVVMVRYIKPPQDRTPEVVDLIASDSDAVIIEDSQMETDPGPSMPSTSGLVKLSVTSNPGQSILLSDTNSEGSHKRRHTGREKSKYLRTRYLKHVKTVRESASTECTDRDTDESSSSDSSSSSASSYVLGSGQGDISDVGHTFIQLQAPIYQPSTSFGGDSKRHKSKKSKNKKISKKSTQSISKKKHKLKSKGKKRHKDKHDHSGKSSKGKSSAKSKVKNGRDEMYDADSETPVGYWPREGSQSDRESPVHVRTKAERKTLRSVVSMPLTLGPQSGGSYSMPHVLDGFSSSDDERPYNINADNAYKPLDLRTKDCYKSEE